MFCSCFSKLQFNSLAFVAILKRATDSLPEIAQYSPFYLSLSVFTGSKPLYFICRKKCSCNFTSLMSKMFKHT